MLRFGATGGIPVFGCGRWWTLLSAGWLHGGLLHIGFNLYWIRFLAPETAELYGPARMVIIYSLSSVTGFLASSLLGVPLTLGASAPILGLLGALVYYGRRTGSGVVGRTAWSYAIFMIVFGFLMPGVDNWAHLGGFAGGFLAGSCSTPASRSRAITPWRRSSAWRRRWPRSWPRWWCRCPGCGKRPSCPRASCPPKPHPLAPSPNCVERGNVAEPTSRSRKR